MWGTWVQSLGWEDPLEKGMTTHSSILAWRIPWMGKPGGLQPMGSQKSQRRLKRPTLLKSQMQRSEAAVQCSWQKGGARVLTGRVQVCSSQVTRRAKCSLSAHSPQPSWIECISAGHPWSWGVQQPFGTRDSETSGERPYEHGKLD